MYETKIMKSHEKNFARYKYFILKCFPLAISNQLYFLRLSKVWSMLHYGSVGRVQNQNKECHYIFINILFWHFFVLFVTAKVMFLSFSILLMKYQISAPKY